MAELDPKRGMVNGLTNGRIFEPKPMPHSVEAPKESFLKKLLPKGKTDFEKVTKKYLGKKQFSRLNVVEIQSIINKLPIEDERNHAEEAFFHRMKITEFVKKNGLQTAQFEINPISKKQEIEELERMFKKNMMLFKTHDPIYVSEFRETLKRINRVIKQQEAQKP